MGVPLTFRILPPQNWNHPSLPPPASSLLGVCLIAFSAFLFALMSFLVSEVSKELPTPFVMLVWCSFQTLVTSSLCFIQKSNPFGPEGDRKWVMMRGVIGSTCNLLFYLALIFLPLGDATTLFFTSPVFTIFFCALLLGEKTSKIEFFSCFFGLFGSVLVIRPPFLFGGEEGERKENKVLLASLMSLGGAVICGLIPITVRKMSKNVNSNCLSFSFAFWGIFSSFSMLNLEFREKNTEKSEKNSYFFAEFGVPEVSNKSAQVYFKVFLICLVATSAQLAFNKGMQLEKPQICAIIRQLDVFFAFSFEIYWIGLFPPFLTILGAFMVVGSSSCVVLEKLNFFDNVFKKHFGKEEEVERLNRLES